MIFPNLILLKQDDCIVLMYEASVLYCVDVSAKLE